MQMLHFGSVNVFWQRKAPCSQSVRLPPLTRDNQSLIRGIGPKEGKKSLLDSAADQEGGTNVFATPPGGEGMLRIVSFYTTGWKQELLQQTGLLSSLFVCSSPRLLFLFPARSLEWRRGGCASVGKEFWTTPPPPPPPQIKHFYNHSWDQHIYQ